MEKLTNQSSVIEELPQSIKIKTSYAQYPDRVKQHFYMGKHMDENLFN